MECNHEFFRTHGNKSKKVKWICACGEEIEEKVVPLSKNEFLTGVYKRIIDSKLEFTNVISIR